MTMRKVNAWPFIIWRIMHNPKTLPHQPLNIKENLNCSHAYFLKPLSDRFKYTVALISPSLAEGKSFVI